MSTTRQKGAPVISPNDKRLSNLYHSTAYIQLIYHEISHIVATIATLPSGIFVIFSIVADGPFLPRDAAMLARSWES